MKKKNTIFGIFVGLMLILVMAAVSPNFIGNLQLTGNMTGNSTNSITNVANVGSPSTVYYGSAANMSGISGSGLTAIGGKGSNNSFFNPANTNASFWGLFQGGGTNAPTGFVWTATDSIGHAAFMASQGGGGTPPDNSTTTNSGGVLQVLYGNSSFLSNLWAGIASATYAATAPGYDSGQFYIGGDNNLHILYGNGSFLSNVWASIASATYAATAPGYDSGQFLIGGSDNNLHLAPGVPTTNINLWGTPSFPIPGTSLNWQMEPINNTFIILDINGNVALQITNNLLGAQLFGDLTLASNLWFGMNNPTIHNHGTAQWSGNLNIAGALTLGGNPLVSGLGGQGSNNVFNGTTTTNATNVGRFPVWTNSISPFYVQPGWQTTGGGLIAQMFMFGGLYPWSETVYSNTFSFLDINSQSVLTMTNVVDAIGLHGPVNVDSNLSVAGNISAANLGSAASLPATTWQGTNAALTAWQGHGTNDFVGSQGGKGSNNVLTSPQTTNLTEWGTLTAPNGFSMSAGFFTADNSGNVTLFGTEVNYLTIGANFAATGSQNFFTHPQNGVTKLNITSQSLTDTDALEDFWGINPYGINQTSNYCDWQVQPFGALDIPYIYYNITNANGNLALLDNLNGPTWNVIVQTAAGNTTLTLPTSTNWSMSIYSGNADTRNSTLFGSNTCLFDIDNAGGGNMTIRTYDHAMIYMGGGQAGSTNPVLTNGFACRLFYGGVNGTNIYNLNTGLFPPGGGSASTFDSGTFGYNGGSGTNALPLSNNITAGWSNAVRTASNVVFGLIPSTNVISTALLQWQTLGGTNAMFNTNWPLGGSLVFNQSTKTLSDNTNVLNANQIGWGQIPTNQLISSNAASTDGQGYAISNHLGVVTLTPIPPAGSGGTVTSGINVTGTTAGITNTNTVGFVGNGSGVTNLQYTAIYGSVWLDTSSSPTTYNMTGPARLYITNTSTVYLVANGNTNTITGVGSTTAPEKIEIDKIGTNFISSY